MPDGWLQISEIPARAKGKPSFMAMAYGCDRRPVSNVSHSKPVDRYQASARLIGETKLCIHSNAFARQISRWPTLGWLHPRRCEIPNGHHKSRRRGSRLLRAAADDDWINFLGIAVVAREAVIQAINFAAISKGEMADQLI